MKHATLVYQAGIANVFSHDVPSKVTNANSSSRKREMQSDFRTCEAFAAGLKRAGVKVKTAWCNQAGDIAMLVWNFENFEEAPWSEKFVIFA